MMSIRSPLARLLAPLPTHLRDDAARRYARQEAVLLDRLGSLYGQRPDFLPWLGDLMDRQERFEVLDADLKTVENHIGAHARAAKA